ncbi:MAG: hypothetical protein AB7O24_00045 [Kofleriaceae bacterium]
MRKIGGAIALSLMSLTGCVGDLEIGPDTDEGTKTGTEQPRPSSEGGDDGAGGEMLVCDLSVSLEGKISQTEILNPMTVTGVGTKICLDLDGTGNLGSPHFVAATSYEDGSVSSFELTLLDPMGGTMEQGWDVAIGGTPPQVSAHLEHDVPVGQVTQAVLIVRAPSGMPATTLGLSLFEPLD